MARGHSRDGHRFVWESSVDPKTMRPIERGQCRYCEMRALRDAVPGERGGTRPRTRYWVGGKLVGKEELGRTGGGADCPGSPLKVAQKAARAGVRV